MNEYWVDVRFRVRADDEGDAANKVHGFVPDVDADGDIIMWTLANSLVALVPKKDGKNNDET